MKSRFLLPGRFYWFLLAAVVAGVVRGPSVAAQDTSAGHQAMTLVVENGGALAPAQINTRQDDSFFLVDTGAEATIIDVAERDEIWEVDGTPLTGWSGTRVVDPLRGPEGTKVTARLRRGDETILRTLRRERLL